MKCRKCGHSNSPDAWVCARCEYILDASFLGEDILNERTRDGIDDGGEALLPAVALSQAKNLPPVTDAELLGGDALILGRLDGEDVEAIVTDRTGGFLPVESIDVIEAPRAVYVTAEIARLVVPGRVLRPVADAMGRRDVLSAFELTVFELLDGKRTLAEVGEVAELSHKDLCIAVAMLHDKAIVEEVPSASKRRPPQTLAQLDDHTAELTQLPPLAEPAGPPPGDDVPPPFDSLEMEALAAQPQLPPQLPPPPPRPVAAASTPPPIRPAAQFRPAMPAPGPRTKPKVPDGAPASAASTPPSPAAAALAAAKAKAANYYELCMKDVAAGRLGRAWGYAKMAADADPADEKLQALLADWHRSHGGAHGEKASTPQELMAAAQEAESRNEVEKAVEILRKLVTQAPKSAAAHNKLAVLLATRMKSFRAAYNSAIRAVELEPGNMAYQSNMMKILARVENDDVRADAAGAPGGGLLGRLLRK